MSIYTWSENKSIAFHYYSFSENANANCNIVSEFIKKQFDANKESADIAF